MSRKARVTSLEAVRGAVTSFKMVMSPSDGVYEAGYPKAKLTRDADGKFYYADGTSLHGDAKEENTQTIVIMRDE